MIIWIAYCDMPFSFRSQNHWLELALSVNNSGRSYCYIGIWKLCSLFNLCIQKTLNYICHKRNSVPACYLPKPTSTKGNRVNGGNRNEKIETIVIEESTVHEVDAIIMVVGFGAGTITSWPLYS